MGLLSVWLPAMIRARRRGRKSGRPTGRRRDDAERRHHDRGPGRAHLGALAAPGAHRGGGRLRRPAPLRPPHRPLRRLRAAVARRLGLARVARDGHLAPPLRPARAPPDLLPSRAARPARRGGGPARRRPPRPRHRRRLARARAPDVRHPLPVAPGAPGPARGGARVIRALGEGRPGTLEQPYYPLAAAQSPPPPARGRLPLIIGARGERRGLRIVAAHADEWNTTRVTFEEYAAKRRALEEHCRALGRDPAGLRRSLMVPVAVGRSAEETAALLERARAVFPRMPEDAAGWRAAGFLCGSPADGGRGPRGGGGGRGGRGGRRAPA